MSRPFLTLSATEEAVVLERARLETALGRLYAASGDSFGTVVTTTQDCLRRLAARVQAEGGDIGGWIL